MNNNVYLIVDEDVSSKYLNDTWQIKVGNMQYNFLNESQLYQLTNLGYLSTDAFIIILCTINPSENLLLEASELYTVYMQDYLEEDEVDEIVQIMLQIDNIEEFDDFIRFTDLTQRKLNNISESLIDDESQGELKEQMSLLSRELQKLQDLNFKLKTSNTSQNEITEDVGEILAACTILADLYVVFNRTTQAIEYYNLVIETIEYLKSNDYQEALLYCLEKLANAYVKVTNHISANEIYKQAIDLRCELGLKDDAEKLAYLYHQLGHTYAEIDEFSKCTESFKKSLEIYLVRSIVKGELYKEHAEVYKDLFRLGVYLYNELKYKEAIEIFKFCSEAFMEVSDDVQEECYTEFSNAQLYLSESCLRIEEPYQAERYYLMSIAYNQELGYDENIANLNYFLAKLYFEQERFDEVTMPIQEAIAKYTFLANGLNPVWSSYVAESIALRAKQKGIMNDMNGCIEDTIQAIDIYEQLKEQGKFSCYEDLIEEYIHLGIYYKDVSRIHEAIITNLKTKEIIQEAMELGLSEYEKDYMHINLEEGYNHLELKHYDSALDCLRLARKCIDKLYSEDPKYYDECIEVTDKEIVWLENKIGFNLKN